MSDMISNQVWVAFAEEGAYGVDATPSPATDAFLCESITIEEDTTEIAIQNVRETAPAPGVTFGRSFYKGTITGRLAGPVDPGVGALADSEIVRVLEGCGLKRTAQDIGATGNTNRLLFELASLDAQKSYTLCHWQAVRGSASAERIRVLGCVFGNLKLSLGADAVVTWSVEFSGLYEPSTSVAKPASSVFLHPEDSSGPAQVCTITVDGRTDEISNLEISWPHTIVPRMARNEGSYGIAGFDVMTKPQVITCDPVAVLTSVYDRQAKVNAETRVAVSISIPTREGGLFVYTAPTAQMAKYKVNSGDDVRLALTLYPTDSDGGTGDDASSFYFERV